METPFRFISLGGDCQPGYHSRRVMESQDIPFVFDWLETPIEAAISLIETEFRNFFAADHLLWENRGDYWSVTDQVFGVTSHHHFKSGAPEPIELVAHTFRLFGRRFMNMLRSDLPAIFVRRWIEPDGPGREDAAKRLHDCIKVFRPDNVLLYLQPHDPGGLIINGRFISAFSPETKNPAEWTGYTALYDRNFNRARRLSESLNINL